MMMINKNKNKTFMKRKKTKAIQRLNKSNKIL